MNTSPARVGWFGDRAVSPRYETEAVPFNPAHLVAQLPAGRRNRPPLDLGRFVQAFRP